MSRKLIAALFTLALASVAAAQDVPLFTSDFPPEEFAARRAKVFAAIGENLAVFQGAPSPEGYTRFRQSNEMYYLSGIEVPHAYLVLNGANKRTALYAREYKGEQAPALGQVQTPKEREKAEMLQKEHKNLSDREKDIYRATKDLATGKNQ